MRSSSGLSAICLSLLVLLAVAPAVRAACGNNILEAGEQCDDGSSQNGGANSCCNANCTLSDEAPDVIVGMLYGSTNTGGDLFHWGNSGGISAYSVGTKSCNVGDCWLKWISSTNEHPVIGQNMYRLKDGRFEHIGQSWLKHGFTALTQNLCGTCNPPGTGSRLGVNCSDPYSANLNGDQSRLGPKWQVNPSTGAFPYPYAPGSGSGALYKRLQIRNGDLNPALNAGASYFVEAQYVTLDDAAAGNQDNNASYRRVTVSGTTTFTITLLDSTMQESPAIKAWKAMDASVEEDTLSAGDGLFFLSAQATPLLGNVYHYEYAVFNLNSDRAGQSFSVPIPPGASITNVGFHDVDYHSGEPFAGTDWTATVSATSVTWETETFATNPNANALRWGTLYNFRFDADRAPGAFPITLGLFKPGSPASLSATSVAPGGCVGAADGIPCTDSSACTPVDTCQAGACSGAPVVCTAADDCHDVGTCDSGTGICSSPAKADGSSCADGDACTQTDACASGACTGSNPVVCVASGACHAAGICEPSTGLCTDPEEPDGTPCDDLNECTEDDTCDAGVCAGTGDALPTEVESLAVSQSEGVTTITWGPAPGAAWYDVLRGLVSALPVGPGGGDELCLDDNEEAFSATDTDNPDPDQAFWYLVGGENSCGKSYGSGRESTTCP